MTIKIPIRTIYNANGDPTGLGEFQSGEKIGYLHGGTGLSTIGTAGQTLVVNDSASGLEWGAGFAASDARTAISVTDAGGDGSLAYNNSTGVLTYTGPSASEVRAHFSAAGDLSYNQSTGEFSFDVENVYTQANFDSDFNTSLDAASLGGTGLTYTAGTNTLSITNTGVTAAEYGSASLVPVITVNAQGQITAASTVSVAGVSSTSWDSATGNLIINTADGGSFYTKVTLDPYDTDNLAEGSTNLYYTDARADARIAAATTDDLTEGSTNLYYTDARARSAISVTDNGGDGALSYNSSTGAISYTGPSASEVRAHFSAGTGVSISNGQVSIGQAVGTTDSAVFASLQTTGNIVVGGDLTVNGTTTTVNSTTLDVADKNITVASGAASAAAANGAGLTVDGASATITYSSTGDKWSFNKPIDVSGNIIVSGTVDGRDLATDGSKLDGIESGATADQSDAEIKTAYENNSDTNAFTDALLSKLNNIEANATADQSASEILTAIKTVDGSGSGLDADTLDGIQASSFLRSDTNDALNNVFDLDFTTGNTYNYIPADNQTALATTPFSALAWHDVLAFNRYYSATQEEYNGSSWSSVTLDANLFAQKENQSRTIATGSTITKVRWNFTNTAWIQPGWLAIGFAYVANSPSKTVIVESSSDGGSTWTTRHQSTTTASGKVVHFRLTDHGGDDDLRVTIERNDSLNLELSYISLLTARAGDQGKGKEDQLPFSWNADQDITFTGDVSAPNFNSTSDAQLKENVETITSALDKVDSIRGVTFDWKDTGKTSMGVIAQEVETIAPEVVSEIDGYKAVNYDGLIGLLIESIKELKQEIADLKQN